MPNEHSNTPPDGQQPQTIPLSEIHDLPGVFNPKPVESQLGSMILSIQNSGVMEPVILRQRDDGEYQLLSGYRRRVASERAGKKDIPAFVYEMTMQEAIKPLVALRLCFQLPGQLRVLSFQCLIFRFQAACTAVDSHLPPSTALLSKPVFARRTKTAPVETGLSGTVPALSPPVHLSLAADLCTHRRYTPGRHS